MTIIKQLLATGIMSYVCTTLGLLYTLPSSTNKIFTSENTTLDRVMNEIEISLMGSISCGSTLLITPFCGYLLDVLGRKQSMIIFFIPQLLAWILLVSIYRVEAFICAMFLCGLSGSIFLIVPVYINEFCDPSIRGALSSSAIISHGLGMLTSYGLGGMLEYTALNYTGLSLAVIGLILLSFLRESPLYLMRKGFDKEAAESVAFYRGLSPDCKEVITEIETLRRLLNNDSKIVDDLPELERLNPDLSVPKKNLSYWTFLKNSPSTQRALAVVNIIFTTSLFQGLVIVQIFAEPLFAAAVPSMSSSLSSIIFGIVIVITGFFEAYLIELVGRRILLIVASTITGLIAVTLGTQIQFHWGPGWLTAVFIYIYSVSYSFGAGAVPFVLTGEVFLPQIKSFASTLTFEWAYTCSFIILFIYTPLFNTIGLGPLFHIFAFFSFFTALFAFFFLPETKNLPVDVIQKKFLHIKDK